MPCLVPEAAEGTLARAAGERPRPVVILVKRNSKYGVMSWYTMLVHQDSDLKAVVHAQNELRSK